MGRARNRSAAVVACAAALVVTTGVVSAGAQLVPPWLGGGQTPSSEPSTTTTTAPPETTTTTSPPLTLLPPTSEAPPPDGGPSTEPSTDTSAPADPAAGAADPAADPTGEGDGEGGDTAVGGRVVPPDAQALIDSIVRSGPNDNSALVQGAALLEAAGMSHEDAMANAFGRFPILGPSRWSDDWHYPRWTGTRFRFHEGLDMLAPYGTPVVAPVDGIARIGSNALGGLTVKVVEPDGTYWYLAHLSGTAPDLVDGQAVVTGQLVGFVGDSGNAKGGPPHLHFGVYPQGGPAAPPKPVVDSWVAEGAQRVADVLAALAAAPQPAAVTATDITRRLADSAVAAPTLAPSGPPRSELLWASAANPAGGGLRVADATAAAINESIDWDQRAAQQRADDLAWQQATQSAERFLAPLVDSALRQALESRRAP
jgi:murein DD-endopeptidase MepM/ murein hydrolase activator NlpD